MLKPIPIILLLTALNTRLFAGDNPRKVRAVRIYEPLKIDGYLNDNVRRLAIPADNFIKRAPHEGAPASEKTEIKVLFDETALYFGCMFYDSQPDQIAGRLMGVPARQYAFLR